jgi:methylmalonyl-CoA mutase
MASGSYYVEHLSTEIAEMAWEKFLTIEEKGGLLKYFETGALQADLDESIQKRLSKFQSEKQKMVGVNSYENEAADVLEISALKSQSGKGLKKFLLAKEID